RSHLRHGHVNVLVAAPHNVEKQIGIALLMGRLGAIALGIGHCSADHDVSGLRSFEKAEEALVIFAAVLAVDIEGHGMAAANGVESDATLEASAGAAA